MASGPLVESKQRISAAGASTVPHADPEPLVEAFNTTYLRKVALEQGKAPTNRPATAPFSWATVEAIRNRFADKE